MGAQLMLENLKDPKWTATGILYVMGVFVMIYALMNIIHYFLAKDKETLKTGLVALLLAVLLLIPFKVYT